MNRYLLYLPMPRWLRIPGISYSCWERSLFQPGIQGGQLDPLYALSLMVGLAEWKVSCIERGHDGSRNGAPSSFLVPLFLFYLVLCCAGMRLA